MDEDEALRNFCRTMMSRVRNKKSSEDNRRTKKTPGAERQVPAGNQTSLSPCQGPEVQPVPLQLVTMLRLKTFKEDIKRAAEVELHDPAVCTQCQQDLASLALTTFIRRKKTQLQLQALKGRLNTGRWKSETFEGKLLQSLPKPSGAPLWISGGTTR